MSREPERSDPKAILLPSGDQRGQTSAPSWKVTCDAAVPSAFMIQTSLFPLLSEVYAIIVPSGDQSGCVSFPGSSVRRAQFFPSASQTQISLSPPRSVSAESKAIFPPSGE